MTDEELIQEIKKIQNKDKEKLYEQHRISFWARVRLSRIMGYEFEASKCYNPITHEMVDLKGEEGIRQILEWYPRLGPEIPGPNKEELHAYLNTVYPKVVEAWNG